MRARLAFALALCLVPLGAAEAHAQMAPVTAEGRSLVRNGAPFHAFGFNHVASSFRWMCGCIEATRGHDPVPSFQFLGRPTPKHLEAMRQDLAAARRRGANTMRIYVELGHVMRTPTRPRVRTLRALGALLRTAERERIYLDITGNLVWRPHRAPSWYDKLSDRARWRVQARFWRFVARVGSRSPAVLAYELTSEPVIVPDGAWYHGLLGGYYFVPNIARDVPPADGLRAARSWVRLLRRSIRAVDRRHLVGLGMLPYAGDWAFSPQNVGGLLDVLFLHSYPEDGQVERELLTVRAFARRGKPVVLGETYAYRGTLETQREFLLASAPYVTGQLSFWLRGEPTEGPVQDFPNAHYRAALRQFANLKERLR